MTQQDAVPTGPQGPAPAPGPGAAAPPEAPKKNSKVLRIVIGLVVAAVVFGAALWFAKDEPANAKVGDCVSGTAADELQIVDCGAAEAEWKVVGRVEDKAESEMTSACQAFETAQQAFWQGEKGEKGLVLCLAPAK